MRIVGRKVTLLPKQFLMKMKKPTSANFCFNLMKKGNRKIFSLKMPVTGRAK